MDTRSVTDNGHARIGIDNVQTEDPLHNLENDDDDDAATAETDSEDAAQGFIGSPRRLNQSHVISTNPTAYSLPNTMNAQDLISIDNVLHMIRSKSAIQISSEQSANFLQAVKSVLILQSGVIECYRDHGLLFATVQGLLEMCDNSSRPRKNSFETFELSPTMPEEQKTTFRLMLMDSGVYHILASEYMSKSLGAGRNVMQSDQRLAQSISHLSHSLASHHVTHVLFTKWDVQNVLESLEYSLRVLLSGYEESPSQPNSRKPSYSMYDLRPSLFTDIIHSLLNTLLCLASHSSDVTKMATTTSEMPLHVKTQRKILGKPSRSNLIQEKDDDHLASHCTLEEDVLQTIILANAPKFDHVSQLLMACLQLPDVTALSPQIRHIALQLVQLLLPQMPLQFELCRISESLVPLLTYADIALVQTSVNLLVLMNNRGMPIQKDLRNAMITFLGRNMTENANHSNKEYRHKMFQCMHKLMQIDHCRQTAEKMLRIQNGKDEERSSENAGRDQQQQLPGSIESVGKLYSEIHHNQQLFRQLVLTYNTQLSHRRQKKQEK